MISTVTTVPAEALETLADQDPADQKWSPLLTALFVVASSILLWAGLIAGAHYAYAGVVGLVSF